MIEFVGDGVLDVPWDIANLNNKKRLRFYKNLCNFVAVLFLSHIYFRSARRGRRALQYITTIFSLALLFPAQLWLTFGVIILAIFEGYVHNMGIFLFRLRGLSPGWWTAMGMAAFAIWGLVEINQAYDYTGIQWLWATLYFIATFIAMEIGFQKLIKNSFSNTIHSARSFLSERFGTKQ